jgi:hypothetical protein
MANAACSFKEAVMRTGHDYSNLCSMFEYMHAQPDLDNDNDNINTFVTNDANDSNGDLFQMCDDSTIDSSYNPSSNCNSHIASTSTNALQLLMSRVSSQTPKKALYNVL